ncbi:MAG: hypothetical protein JXA53_06065 [Bacteroidales bacterium]|nr:hypothetical protein [Bacteroidales bacterium]
MDNSMGYTYFGARYYDSDLSVWLRVDPYAPMFPSESPYCYAGNNPLGYVDASGLYKVPTDKIEEYEQNYPRIMTYLRENVKNDVMNSPNIMAGLKKFSGGNLTREKVEEMTTWNSGPNFIIVDNPGSDGDGWMFAGANGYYNESTNTIQISTKIAKQFENAATGDLQAALFAFYVTLLHESVHYGDYLDGARQSSSDESGFGSEPGWFFQNEVFYSKMINVKGEDIPSPQLQYDHTTIEGAKALIKMNIDEGKSDVVPNVPMFE